MNVTSALIICSVVVDVDVGVDDGDACGSSNGMHASWRTCEMGVIVSCYSQKRVTW